MYNILKKAKGKDVVSTTGICEVLVDGEADLETLPTELMPGSVAYTASMAEMWQKNNAGTWEKIGGDD